MTYVLGIDGGGTKTTGVMADETGKTIAEVTVGASNPNIVGTSDLIKTFTKLKNELLRENEQAFNQVNRLFAGISGTGHPSARKKIQNVLKEVMPPTMAITVDNDAVIALYSGTLGKPGIVQISGTGSITYGVNYADVRDRVGGWGHFIGEKGSGYGLGYDALQAAFSAYDQLGPATILEEGIRNFFNEASLPDIIPSIYQAERPKETIAALGRIVMKAADQDDDVAKGIIHQNGHNIGQCINVLIQKLFLEDVKRDDAVPIVLAGGLFNRNDLFKDAIDQELNKQPTATKLIIPQQPPVSGAVFAALGMEPFI